MSEVNREEELSKALVVVYDQLVYIKTMLINDELTDDKLTTELSFLFNYIESKEVLQL